MERNLIIYPNLSMGGMASVYRNRILSDPDNFYDMLFLYDKGGRSVYRDLSNVNVHIVRKDRLSAYLKYLFTHVAYDNVFVTSVPDIASIAAEHGLAVSYEFHTSTESIIKNECLSLSFNSVKRIMVPSVFLKDVVKKYIPVDFRELVDVVPNLVDRSVFNHYRDSPRFAFEGVRPLVWVGRLDAGKNVNDFLRMLTLLDDEFEGVVILGLESDPARFASFLGYASSLGVKDRIHIFVNLPHNTVADFFALAKQRGGFFVSTSLGESFGYGVQEALETGLNTVAYDVGALRERKAETGSGLYSLVDVGAIDAMANAIKSSEFASPTIDRS